MPINYNNMESLPEYIQEEYQEVPLTPLEKAPLSSCVDGVQPLSPYISVVGNVVSFEVHTGFVDGLPNGATPADLIEFAHSLMATANPDFPVESNQGTIIAIRAMMTWKNRRPL